MGFYTSLVRPILFSPFIPLETTHFIGKWFLKRGPLWKFASSFFDQQDPRLQVQAAGLTFSSPVGFAAGLDKDCEFLDSLLHLGFGYVVGGSIVPEAQRGNSKPRLIRKTKEQGIINALGFPSKGMRVAKKNLERASSRISKRNKLVVVSVTGLSIDEFQACHATMEPLADATELNISSPNTQGLRIFQEPDTFKSLVERINSQRSKPIFIKIPHYDDNQGQERVLSLVRIAREMGVDGITATNTKLVEEPKLKMKQGGLSGRALLEDTIRIVAEVRTEAGPAMAINACGGIFTVDDAVRALQAGANTVQLLTGLIYRGPGVARSINRGLVKQIELSGCSSLEDLLAPKHTNNHSSTASESQLAETIELASRTLP